MIKKLYLKLDSFSDFFYASCSIFFASVVLLFGRYQISMVRFFDACSDFGRAMGHYFTFIWNGIMKNGEVVSSDIGIADLPDISFRSFLPFSDVDWLGKINSFFDLNSFESSVKLSEVKLLVV